MARQGKQYREALAKVTADSYGPADAVKLAKEASYVKFNETVELHVHTSADPRQQGQQMRETAQLPSGTGKPVRVMVFAASDLWNDAKGAGADLVSDDETLEKIEKGWTEFDVAIATQDMMPRIAKLGRILGRKGLMPSPRSGTVVKTEAISESIAAAKRGKVEVRMDKGGSIHVPIGVIQFKEEEILANLNAVYATIAGAKPSAIKGAFITKAILTTTMGPSIPLDIEKFQLDGAARD